MHLHKFTQRIDWWLWISEIEDFAKVQSVWAYIDPDGTTPEPERPVLDPSLSELNNEDSVVIRDGRELELWTVCLEYQKNIKQYEQVRSALLELRTAINESIPKKYRPRPGPELSVREAIQFLRARLKPSQRECSFYFSNRLKLLNSPKQGTNVENWLQEWRDFITDSRYCHVYDKKYEFSLLTDFYHCANILMPIAFTEIHEYKTMEKTSEEIDLLNVISDFQFKVDRIQKEYDLERELQGNGTSSGDTERSHYGQLNHQKDKRTDCFCGQIHRFRQCPYVNPTVRSADWVPDPAVQARFDGPMHPVVKKVLNNARKSIAAVAKREYLPQEEPQQQKNNIVEFHTPKDSTSAFDCELHDSWIISITSTRHVCNDLSLFKRFDPVYDGSVLKLGSKSVPILASGVVEIHPTADNGQRFTMTLNNTAYVPDMHTNIFSIQKTEQRGVYYNGRLNRLEERDGQPFCQLFFSLFATRR